MDLNKKYFLDFLSGKPVKPVIFEPFLSRAHSETLIWRRGDDLWLTPEKYLDTLTHLSARTYSDIVFVDMRLFDEDGKKLLLKEISKKDISPQGYGIITDNENDIAAAEKTNAIDVIAVYGDIKSSCTPTIRMDGDITDALQLGYKGWFASDSAEEYLEKSGDKIRILGGLGVQRLESSSPAAIYARVTELHKKYGSSWACGSGGTISDDNYLELIAMLGAFGRIRI
jgi:hypothetical protein